MDVMRGNPFCIVGFSGGSGGRVGCIGRGRFRSFRALCLNCGLLSLITSLRLTFLRKVRRDPDIVEEIYKTRKARQEKDIEEYTTKLEATLIRRMPWGCAEQSHSHLRVKDAGIRFHNAHGRIIGRD